MARYRVLIVDDQRDIRRVLSAGLSQLPIKVDVVDVPSAEEAMLVAASGAFDLMVADVRLPGISGLDLFRRVKKLHPNMQFMLMTGMTDPATRSQVEGAGAVAYFYKPIDMEAFIKVVQSCLAFRPGAEVGITPKTQAESAEAEKPMAVMDRLEVVRRKAVAGLAALLDTQGNLIKQAGFLTGVFEQPGLTASLARLYASGIAAAQQLGRADIENLFYIAGKDYHFYLASVNPSYVLVLTMEQPFDQRLGEFNQWLPGETRDLDRILSGRTGALPVVIAPALQAESPAEVSPDEEQPAELRPIEEAELANVEVSEEDQAAVDALFSQAGKQEIKKESLDDFWDNLAEESGSLHVQDGSITYDQARDMGLAPD